MVRTQPLQSLEGGKEESQDYLKMPMARKPLPSVARLETFDEPQTMSSTTEPEADSIRGAGAIIRRFSDARRIMEAEELRRLHEEKLKDEVPRHQLPNGQVPEPEAGSYATWSGTKMISIKAVLPTAFKNYVGYGLAAIKADPSKRPAAPYSCIILASAPWAELVQRLAHVISEPEARVRLWIMEDQGGGMMPAWPVLQSSLEFGILSWQEKSYYDLEQNPLFVWVEVGDHFPEYRYLHGFHRESQVFRHIHMYMLLLIKVYDPALSGFRGAGHCYVVAYETLQDCAPSKIAPLLGVQGSLLHQAMIQDKVTFHAEVRGKWPQLDLKTGLEDLQELSRGSLANIICVQFNDATVQDGPRTFAEMGIKDSGNGDDCVSRDSCWHNLLGPLKDRDS